MPSGDVQSGLSEKEVERLITAEIYEHQLGATLTKLKAPDAPPLDPGSAALVRRAAKSLEIIGSETRALYDTFVERFEQAGVPLPDMQERRTPTAPQFQHVDFSIPASAVPVAMRIAAEEGFAPADRLGRGAIKAMRRLSTGVEFLRRDTVCSRVSFEWPPSLPGRVLPTKLRPTPKDYVFVDLPAWLWPAYLAIKPLRVAWSRTFGPPRALGEYLAPASLGTPLSLVEPLATFGEISRDDHLLDVGCGDGRFLIETVLRTGCRGTGVEMDRSCAWLAAKAVREAGLNDRICIVEGKITPALVASATRVFTFIPSHLQSSLLPMIVRNLSDRALLFTHEQLPLAEGLTPDETRPVFGENALTVAHLWRGPHCKSCRDHLA